jgi:hypothetical protein
MTIFLSMNACAISGKSFALKFSSKRKKRSTFCKFFKRKNFGNEKIYEKRLNLRGRALLVRRFEF